MNSFINLEKQLPMHISVFVHMHLVPDVFKQDSVF